MASQGDHTVACQLKKASYRFADQHKFQGGGKLTYPYINTDSDIALLQVC